MNLKYVSFFVFAVFPDYLFSQTSLFDSVEIVGGGGSPPYNFECPLLS